MTILASTSRVQLRVVKETAFGVTPVAGNGRKLRMQGESLAFNLTKEESKEIRADRQVAGAVTVDAEASGGVNIHNQYAEYDILLEGALQSAFTVFGTNGVGATFTSTMTLTTITASAATSGSSIFTNLQPGQWFQLNAPGDPNDKTILRVSTTVAPTATVLTLDPSTPAIAAVGVALCTINTSRLTNGSVQPSYTLEKEFGDIAQFLAFRGMTVSKMGLNFSSGALTDGSFDFIGKDSIRATATTMPGVVAESQTYDIQNGVRGIGNLWEGGAPITGTFIKSMTWNVDNSLRAQKALGNLGSVGIGVGDFKASGTIEVYFANGVMYDKFLNDVYTSLITQTQDAAKNGYAYSMPRVLLSNGKVVAGGKNQDAMLSFDWQAFSDDANANAALRKSVFIDRFGAAVVP